MCIANFPIGVDEFEVVLDGDQLASGRADAPDRDGGVGGRPGEPVELRDRDPAGLPALDALQRLHELRPVGPGPGLVEVGVPVDDPVTVEIRERLDLLLLHVRAR